MLLSVQLNIFEHRKMCYYYYYYQLYFEEELTLALSQTPALCASRLLHTLSALLNLSLSLSPFLSIAQPHSTSPPCVCSSLPVLEQVGTALQMCHKTNQWMYNKTVNSVMAT